MLGYLCLTSKKNLVQASTQEKLLKICSSRRGYLCNAAESRKMPRYLWCDRHLSEGTELSCSCWFPVKIVCAFVVVLPFHSFWLLHLSPSQIRCWEMHSTHLQSSQKWPWSSRTCILFLQPVGSWKITHTYGLKIKEELCVNPEIKFHSVFDILFLPALGQKCRI